MTSPLIDLIVDEGKWLTASMGLAILAATLLLFVHRLSAIPAPRRILAAMNLFFGVTIGAMAFGHLLAISTKLAFNTLEGPIPGLYAIGVALAAPSWWLVYHTRRVLASNRHGRGTLFLNIWLATTLVALGLHNLPLAAPGLFNSWYYLTAHRVVGWAIVALAVVTNVGLFIASLIFLSSGQSFEQFRGI